jgi:HEPN domain-containing protein
MKTPDQPVLDKVRQWLIYADEDLRLATAAMEHVDDCPYRLVAYHAQQCAEKYIKAFLVYSGVDFPYTHNIRRLLKLCSQHADWAEQLRQAEELTPYAITARYPGQADEVTQGEAAEAIELAQQVRAQVRKALKQLGIELPK